MGSQQGIRTNRDMGKVQSDCSLCTFSEYQRASIPTPGFCRPSFDSPRSNRGQPAKYQVGTHRKHLRGQRERCCYQDVPAEISRAEILNGRLWHRLLLAVLREESSTG